MARTIEERPMLDPASAVAVAKCLMSRNFPGPLAESRKALGMLIHAHHPEPCLWEDYSKPDLVAMLSEFNEWAEYDIARNVHHNPTVQAFRRLPRDVQAAQVRAAQYVSEGVTA